MVCKSTTVWVISDCYIRVVHTLALKETFNRYSDCSIRVYPSTNILII